MKPTLPLIDHIGHLLERTYDFRCGLLPLGRFVVGDDGHRRLRERYEVAERVDGQAGGACVLLRPLPDTQRWAAVVYLPDELVALLEEADPRRELHRGNIAAFGTLIEEVDHLLTFADRIGRRGAVVSLLELEWHAAISKYLSVAHFAARLERTPRLSARSRALIEAELFGGEESGAEDPQVRERYRRAEALAQGFLEAAGGLPTSERLRYLRRFHRANHFEKLRRFATA